MEIILESQFRGGHYITSRISPELERLPHSIMIETLLKYFNQKAQCRSMASKPTYGKNRFQTSMEQCFYHYQLNRAAKVNLQRCPYSIVRKRLTKKK